VHLTDTLVGIRVGTTISVKDGPLNATWIAVGAGTGLAVS